MFKISRITQCALLVCIIMLMAITPVYAADVLVTVRDRGVALLKGLKPVIFILAGFGLIGFAWMAIFNQISWKWFSNIAIGLFLVANMGIFIDYFTSKNGDSTKYAQMLGRADYKDNMGSGYQATSGTDSDPLSQTPGSDEGPGGPQSSDELESVLDEAIKKASNESDCNAVGGTWADGKCAKSSSTGGLDEASFADAAAWEQELAQNKDQASCSANGGVWDNNKCVASWNVGENATSFSDRLDCANSGGNWDGKQCVKNSSTPTMTSAQCTTLGGIMVNDECLNKAEARQLDPSKFLTMNSCTSAGHMWNGSCVKRDGSSGGVVAGPGSGDIVDNRIFGSNAIISEAKRICANSGGTWNGEFCENGDPAQNNSSNAGKDSVDNTSANNNSSSGADDSSTPTMTSAQCTTLGGIMVNNECLNKAEARQLDPSKFLTMSSCTSAGHMWNGSCVKRDGSSGGVVAGPGSGDIVDNRIFGSNAIISEAKRICANSGGTWNGEFCENGDPARNNSSNAGKDSVDNTSVAGKDSVDNTSANNYSSSGSDDSNTPTDSTIQDIAQKAYLASLANQKDANGCGILGGIWTGTQCVAPGASNPDSIVNNDSNSNSGSGSTAPAGNTPSGAQMYDLAEKLQEQYKENGKINLSQLLREEVAAGRMTAEQAAQAGSIFTQVSQDKSGNIDATIKDVLKGAKEQAKEEFEAQQQAERDAFLNQNKGGASDIGNTTPGDNSGNDSYISSAGEKVENISFYACSQRGGTWTEDGKCKGAAPAKITSNTSDDEDNGGDDNEDYTPDPRDEGISQYGCSRTPGKVWDDKTGSCIDA